MLVKYVRNRKNMVIGAVVAMANYKDFNNVNRKNYSIGWSMCRKGDQFDKTLGLKIAEGRALNGSTTVIPVSMKNDIEYMNNRAMKYFKNDINFD